MNKYLSGLLVTLLIVFSFNNLNCKSQEVDTVKKFMPIEEVVPEHTSLQMGIDAYEEGRYKDAVNYLTAAINKNPDNAYVSLWLANAYFRNEDYDNAVIYYKNAIENDDTYGLAYYNLYIAYERLGDMDEAQDAIDKFEAIKKEINDDDEE